MPPLPPYEGLHPLVVHFPIGLLMSAPVLLLIAMFVPTRRATWAGAALVVIALGTFASFLAVSTGEAAAEIAEQYPAAEQTLERHEEMGETTRVLFAILTLLYSGVVAAVALRGEKMRRLIWIGVTGVYLVLYAGGLVYLANTGHEGGRLVHVFGVQAPFGEAAAPAPLGEQPQAIEEDHEEGEREEH